MKKPILFFTLLFSLIILRFFLFDHGATKALYDFDEARYAQVARNIVKSNNWLFLIGGYPDNIKVSHIGMVDFWKPPLHPIMIALSYKLLGVNEFAVRLPSLLFFLGNCVLVFLLARLLDEKHKVLPYFAVVLFALLPDNAFLYSQGIAEQQLLFFNLMAIYIFLNKNGLDWIPAFAGMTLRQAQGKHSTRMCVFAGICWGLAILTKGAAAWWVPPTILLLSAINGIKNKQIIKLIINILIFLGVGVLVAMPWHVYMYLKFEKLFVDHYLLINTIGRSLGTTSNIAPIWWYGAWMMWNWRPIIFLLPLIMGQIINTNNGANNQNNNMKNILLWFLLIIIPFSFIKSKVWWYIYPASVPLIILSAKLLLDRPKLVLIISFISLFPFWNMGAMSIKTQFIVFTLFGFVLLALQKINFKRGDKILSQIALVSVITISLFFSIRTSLSYKDTNKDLKILLTRNAVKDLTVYKIPYEAALFYADTSEIKNNNLQSTYLITKKEFVSQLMSAYRTFDMEGDFVLMTH